MSAVALVLFAVGVVIEVEASTLLLGSVGDKLQRTLMESLSLRSVKMAEVLHSSAR